MKPVAVVHLVRKVNGLGVLKDFLAAYREYEAGIEHDVIYVLKGFTDAAEMAPYKELLDGMCTRVIDVPDRGYDITAYWMAAEALEYDYFCYLNSFSRILVPGWLQMLYRAASTKNVGLAGATGSYQSFKPASFKNFLEISRKVRNRGRIKDLLMSLPFSHHLNYLRHRLLVGPGYHAFPNYHVRTNAFVIKREVMRQAARRPIWSKMDAYDFESGRRSLTMSLIQSDLEPIVVGRDATRYPKEDWHVSNTFWQSNQENLLVADNQTRRYTEGNRDLRQLLSHFAWGEYARPSLETSRG